MPLDPGTKIGPYEITAPLGAGGMGEVYRASDTKLRREVAIKILPGELAQFPDRLARFEREAHLLASLNHPNIAAIYGLEEGESGPCLVLELVEGKTLAELIEDGPVPVEKAMRLGLQIAEALEAAHEKGIIHRDLKPANVKVTPDGTVKVLDFGLAKAFTGDSVEKSVDASLSPTLTMAATQAGIIMGTAAYMSPEQAAGKQADRRADIWAFGVVLAEMLTGRRPFQGESVSYVLASVLKDDPDLDSLPVDIPIRIKRLAKRCLHKDPRQRLQAIGDARILLTEYLADPSSFAEQDATASADGALSASATAGRMRLAWGVAGALLITLLVTVVWGFTWFERAQSSSRRPRVLSLALPDMANIRYPTISRDGTKLVFVRDTSVGIAELYLHSLVTGKTGPLDTGNSSEISYPFFSPDGTWVGFVARGDIYKTPAGGGPAQRIFTGFLIYGPSWLEDGRIIFREWSTGTLHEVPASGGQAAELTSLDADPEGSRHSPAGPIPDSHDFLMLVYSILPGGRATATHELLDLETGHRRPASDVTGGPAATIASGHLLWIGTHGGLYRTRLDRDNFAGGPAVKIADDVGGFTVSWEGTLIVAAASRQNRSMVWSDRDGNLSPATGVPYIGHPRFSPDGTKLVGSTRDQIVVHDLDREISSTPFPDPALEVVPKWMPDGKELVFSSNRDGAFNIYRAAADGSEEATRLTTSERDQFVTGITSDGRTISYFEGGDTWLLTEGEPPRQFLGTPALEWGAIMPSGDWVVYQSDESGTEELYIRPVEGEGRWQLTSGGANNWSIGPGEDELYYMLPGRLMRIPLAFDDGTVRAGRPDVLLTGSYPPIDINRRYAPHPDGRFLMTVMESDTEDTASSSFRVLLNWMEAEGS